MNRIQSKLELDLMKKASQLQDELSKTKKELYEERLRLWDIRIGMLVQDQKGLVYRVTGSKFEDSCDNQPWLLGELRKKDGTFGVIRTIYREWTRVS